MKKHHIAIIAMIFALAVPKFAGAAAKSKTLTGIVIKNESNRIVFKTSSAATYSAEGVMASVVRKNGSPMKFNEIISGDKVEVSGMVWPDNSINASYIRNMSLYVHTGTFVGKISSIDPSMGNFTIESRQNGTQIIYTSPTTTFKKGSGSGMFKDLQMGANATIKGTWERSNSYVNATGIEIKVRLVNIDITGKLALKTPSSFTVVGENNVIYGIDISSATLDNKNGKSLGWAKFNMGDILRVKGKHLLEGWQIYGTNIKNLSVTK